MGLPEEGEGKKTAEPDGRRQSGNPDILRVGDYTVQLVYKEDTEETIEDRLLVLARRLSQILLEEEGKRER